MTRAEPVIVITGGSRGRGLVEAFLARGACVAFCARSESSVAGAMATLREAHGDRVAAVAADVSRLADVERLWQLAADRFGAVDVWINSAGTSNAQRDFVELPATDIVSVVGANLIGTMNGAHVALARMRAQGRGHLFTMEGYGSDGSAQRGMSVYGATKTAVRYFTRSLVLETRGSPVRVGSLSPGIVVTDLLVDVYKDGDAKNWARNRRFFNLVADPVDVVAPWLAERVLAGPRHGEHVAWMSVGKAALRVLQPYYWRRDLFAGRLPGG